MKEYLKEWNLGGYGKYDDDAWITNDKGVELLKKESKRLARYFNHTEAQRMKIELEKLKN